MDSRFLLSLAVFPPAPPEAVRGEVVHVRRSNSSIRRPLMRQVRHEEAHDHDSNFANTRADRAGDTSGVPETREPRWRGCGTAPWVGGVPRWLESLNVTLRRWTHQAGSVVQGGVGGSSRSSCSWMAGGREGDDGGRWRMVL
jgi:hypothetical protein